MVTALDTYTHFKGCEQFAGQLDYAIVAFPSLHQAQIW